MRRPFALTAALIASAVGAVLVAVPASAAHTVPPHLFAATSWWNTPLPADAPSSPYSDNNIAKLTGAVTAAGGAAFDIYAGDDATTYSVAAGTPTVTVGWDDCQHKGTAEDPGLAAAFAHVPLTAPMVPASGGDSALSVTNGTSVWEFWKLVKHLDSAGHLTGWSACYGGVTSATGDGIFPFPYGASASGLPAGSEEVKASDVTSYANGGAGITHAVPLELPNIIEAQTPSWPANRTDGQRWDPTQFLYEGQRLILDPAFDVSTLPNVTERAIARAAQIYGFVVTDTASSPTVIGENPQPYLVSGEPDPWKPILAGAGSYTVMRGFPWGSLRVLPKDYGKS